MYRLDWIESLKLRKGEARSAGKIRDVNPTVWKLGFTSLLTDISSEMVNSLLPVYIVLHLHMSPLQFGAIDGIYNGVAIALLSLAAGFIADRTRRPKEVAFAGYSISAVSKMLLLLRVGLEWNRRHHRARSHRQRRAHRATRRHDLALHTTAITRSRFRRASRIGRGRCAARTGDRVSNSFAHAERIRCGLGHKLSFRRARISRARAFCAESNERFRVAAVR